MVDSYTDIIITLTSPFNTQRVINTVKPKLLSVFKVAPRQTISAAVLPKVLLVWSCIIRKTFDVSAGLVMHA